MEWTDEIIAATPSARTCTHMNSPRLHANNKPRHFWFFLWNELFFLVENMIHETKYAGRHRKATIWCTCRSRSTCRLGMLIRCVCVYMYASHGTIVEHKTWRIPSVLHHDGDFSLGGTFAERTPGDDFVVVCRLAPAATTITFPCRAHRFCFVFHLANQEKKLFMMKQ